ncbi:PLD nuclease N-terminal domain-containing protein [Kitasatospora sp. NPDC049285]|uniref:PLD nuclease N-terminal domain-containing protein n=1 Tax=Kitasatospora sp. NPDC049285 TaxID=3157096 RepID=UPI00341E3356
MLRIVPVVALLALWVWAFIDCLTTPDDEVRHLPKVVWAIVVLLFPLVGSIAWLLVGKDRATARRAATARPAQPPTRPVAPDDDPEFLASLNRDNTGDRQHREMLRQWEADLRRREDELRRGSESEGGEDHPKG